MGLAYVGCRTTRERNARGEGLKVYKIDGVTGNWQEIQCLSGMENPSYQTLDGSGTYLYSVHGDGSLVSSYKLKETGKLEYINQLDLEAKNPVFITMDKSNRYLVVATLQGGRVHSLSVNEDGSLGQVVDVHKFPGVKEGSISYAHQSIWDQNKDYIFVPTQARDQGYASLNVLSFDSNTGVFELRDSFIARDYSEPRHLAVHPNNRYLYLMNEKGNNMTFFEFDAKEGRLRPLQNLPSLPDTYTGQGQASASVLSKNGSYLIGSNRIHDSLVVYRIDQNTGYMKEDYYVSCLGKTPRFICFNKVGDRLYVANEDSDEIIEFNFDESSGRLEFSGRIIRTESPVCITFL